MWYVQQQLVIHHWDLTMNITYHHNITHRKKNHRTTITYISIQNTYTTSITCDTGAAPRFFSSRSYNTTNYSETSQIIFHFIQRKHVRRIKPFSSNNNDQPMNTWHFSACKTSGLTRFSQGRPPPQLERNHAHYPCKSPVVKISFPSPIRALLLGLPSPI